MNEILGVIFLIIGVLFDVFGCVGLLRLPDVYNRLQAATKCVTLGTCGIMFGIFLMEGFSAAGIKALIAIPFIFLVAATAAHALARGAYLSGVKLWDRSVVDRYAGDVEKRQKQDKTCGA